MRSGPAGSAALIAYPGFGVDDRSLAPIRRYLTSRGHTAHGWGLGVNRGEPSEVFDACADRLRVVAEQHDGPVHLLGWSLGGVMARELARDHPDLVERVATLATPLFGPRHTQTRRHYAEQRLAEIEAHIDERAETPIERPILAFHSRNDGVVDWRACIDTMSPDVRNVEVRSTHFAMGIDPDVWLAVASWLTGNADGD